MWFINIVACDCILLILTAIKHFDEWLYHSIFIHSTTDGLLNSFQFGAIIKSAAVNILVRSSDEHMYTL